MTVRIGVTGHRHLADPVAVAAAVDTVLDELCPVGHPDAVVVVSSLAEGSDRLVADRVLARPPATLHAVLPLPTSDYRSDFPETAAEFDTYLSRAAAIDVTGTAGTAREGAYQAAGRAMVSASDVVVAVWDGRPAAGQGGTAEIVGYARRRGIPVRVVPAERLVPGEGPTRSSSEAPCR
jgi:hypothetical protein